VYSNKLTKRSYGWVCQGINIEEDFSLALGLSTFEVVLGLKTLSIF